MTGNPHTVRNAMNGEPAAARLRRHELGQGRIADHDLGAEAEPLHEAADDELRHVLRERRGERSKPEDQQVDLVGEAPAHLVADEAGDQRADRHADEGQRQELQVLRQGRELALDRRGQHAAGDVEIVAVEEHAGADQPENPVMKRRHRQAVEPRARIHHLSHVISPRARALDRTRLYRPPDAMRAEGAAPWGLRAAAQNFTLPCTT